MSALDHGMNRRQLVRTQAAIELDEIKSAGGGFTEPDGSSNIFGNSESRSARNKYRLFHGHVHSAVNAIAETAAGQDFCMGKIAHRGKKRAMSHTKSMLKIPDGVKSASEEIERVIDHPVIDAMRCPNSIQDWWQFVYMYVSNLALTGWAYIIADRTSEGPQFYALPTSWIQPVHKDKPFSHFKVIDPSKPEAGQDDDGIFSAEQVGVSYLPDPAMLIGAMSPAEAQSIAVRIDDNIQSSQLALFKNGIFPSVVVTVGKNPHPDLPGGGLRPRLNSSQRRQVYSAIRKASSGVANYGNPAIVDGMIERIDRQSMTANEMGWEKSEKSVRSRILSAFSVHPFILGEAVSVGGHAQASLIYERFYARVNTYLSMLSNQLTVLVPNQYEGIEDQLVLWVEKLIAVDKGLQQTLMKDARKNGDITQNEFRAFMGLPPDEDTNEALIDRSMLTGVSKIAADVKAGALTPEQGQAILIGLGLPDDMAKDIAGEAPEEPVESEDPQAIQSDEELVEGLSDSIRALAITQG